MFEEQNFNTLQTHGFTSEQLFQLTAHDLYALYALLQPFVDDNGQLYFDETLTPITALTYFREAGFIPEQLITVVNQGKLET